MPLPELFPEGANFLYHMALTPTGVQLLQKKMTYNTTSTHRTKSTHPLCCLSARSCSTRSVSDSPATPPATSLAPALAVARPTAGSSDSVGRRASSLAAAAWPAASDLRLGPAAAAGTEVKAAACRLEAAGSLAEGGATRLEGAAAATAGTTAGPAEAIVCEDTAVPAEGAGAET